MPPEHLQIAINIIEDYPIALPQEISDEIYAQGEVLSILVILTLQLVGWRYTRLQVREALHNAGYTRKFLEYRAKEQCAPIRQYYREVYIPIAILNNICIVIIS